MSLINDLITRIRNASMVRKDEFETPFSNICSNFLTILVNEGFISGFKESARDKKRFLVVNLKPYYAGKPVIQEIKAISRPGCRVYVGYEELEKLNAKYSGIAVNIVSTPLGLLSDSDAISNKVGGELICRLI